MSTATDALASLNQAQTLLEQVEADGRRLHAFVDWLGEAIDRAEELGDYYAGQGQDDVAAVLAEDPQAVTPPVANEDSAWDALTQHEDGLLRLLRVVTAALTSSLDHGDCALDEAAPTG